MFNLYMNVQTIDTLDSEGPVLPEQVKDVAAEMRKQTGKDVMLVITLMSGDDIYYSDGKPVEVNIAL